MSEAQDFDLDALKALSAELPREPEAEEPEPEPVSEAPEEPTEPEAKEPEVDPQVDKALKSGWKPLEEYDGDPDDWVDAAEFNRRRPLFDQIKAERKARKDLEKRLEGVVEHASKVEEMTRKRVLEEIEAKRRQAVEDGDVEAFEEADKEYREAQTEPEPEAKVEPEQPEIPEEVQSFAQRNSSWFEKNAAMTDDAVNFTKFYRDQGKPLGEALELAEKDIKRKYSSAFENPNKNRAQTVSEGSSEQRPKTRGYNDLTSEQKQVFAAMKGHLTLKEYVKQLEETGAFDAESK